MFHLEKTLARASKASGDSAGATQYDALANARQQAIEKYLWNDKEGWYADFDLKSHKVRNQLDRGGAVPRCTLMPRHASGRRKWPPPPSRACLNPAG